MGLIDNKRLESNLDIYFRSRGDILMEWLKSLPKNEQQELADHFKKEAEPYKNMTFSQMCDFLQTNKTKQDEN